MENTQYMNKLRTLTMRGINNYQNNRLFKGCSPLQGRCILTFNTPATGNYSYVTMLGAGHPVPVLIIIPFQIDYK